MSEYVQTISGSLIELSGYVYYFLIPHEVPPVIQIAEGQILFVTDQPHQYGCENSSLASHSNALQNERPSENTASLNLRGADGDMVLQVDHINESSNWSSASKEGLAETSTLSGTVDILEETSSNYHRKYSYSESVRDNSEQTARRNFPQNCNDCEDIPVEPCKETYLAPAFSEMEEAGREDEQEGISEEREEMEMEEEDSRNPCSQIHDIAEVVRDETIDVSEDWSSSLKKCTVQRVVYAEKNEETYPVPSPETRQFTEKILHSTASSCNFEQSLCSDDQRVYHNEKTCASHGYEQTSRNDSTLSLDGCKLVHRKIFNRSSGIPFSSTKEPERKGAEETASEENEEELVEAGESNCMDVRRENTGIHEKGDTQERGKEISSSWSTPSGEHWRQLKQRMPYCCDICGKCFRGNTAVESHRRVHTGERPFECPLCMRKFSIKGNLVRHMRVHFGEKPFTCNICKKAFSESQHLQAHMRIHNGERPFKCEECGKGFAQCSTLIRHKRSHTRERLFGCTTCGKHFLHPHHLSRHKHQAHSTIK